MARPTEEAYFTTSYVFNNGTTSTLTLMVWKTMSEYLETHHLPMSGADLMKATGASAEQLEDMFRQPYYRRYYGFRRFDTLDEWTAWAEQEDLLFDPERHLVDQENIQPRHEEGTPA